MVIVTYASVLAIGLVLLTIGCFNFTMAFAAWCAVYPSVAMFTSLPGFDFLPAGRLVTSLLAAEAIALGVGKQRLPKLRGIWLLYALFVAILVVASAASEQRAPSLGRSLTYLEPLMWVLMAATAVRRSTTAPQTVLYGLTLGMIPVIAYGLLELIMQRNVLVDSGLYVSPATYIFELRFGGKGRISTTFGQPVYASIYYLLAIALLIFHVARSRSLFRWITFGGLALLALYCLVFTGSRTGILGLAIAPFGLMFMEGKGWKPVARMLIAYAVGGLIVFAILPIEYQRFLIRSMDPTSSQSTDVIGRLYVTEQLWLKVQGHFLLGLGPGLVQRMALAHADGFQGLEGVENQYLAVLSDAGVFALLTFLAFWAAVFRFLRQSAQSLSPVERGWAVLTGVLLFTVLVLATTVSVVNHPVMTLPLTALGVVIGLRDRSRHEGAPSPAALITVGAGAAGALAADERLRYGSTLSAGRHVD